MSTRTQSGRKAAKSHKQASFKRLVRDHWIVVIACVIALLVGVWKLSAPSAAQGQTLSAQSVSNKSLASLPAASLASFVRPQTPPNIPMTPDGVPTSPRRETDLDLDLSQGGNKFDETLIVPASQPVVLANGRMRLVGQLKPGDHLRMSGQRIALVQKSQTSLYTPPAPQKPDKDGLVSHRVIGTVRHMTDILLYLRTPHELIQTTPEHPFFVHGMGWVEAGKLKQGDPIETSTHRLVPVVSTQVRHERTMVYNLEVEGAHDFFVGKDKLLVHNGGDCVPEPLRPGEMVRNLLPRELKDAASRAFRDNSKLAEMSPEDRELAAQAYEQIAPNTVNRTQELTRLYNLERAKFLRGQVDRIAGSAPEFAKEIGFQP